MNGLLDYHSTTRFLVQGIIVEGVIQAWHWHYMAFWKVET